MPTVNLNSLNFSYYAFHPKSTDLSRRDQKVAMVATLLMGALTLGVGHLICRIVYRINKTGIDSSRLAVKTHNVSIKNKDLQENSIDEPIKKFREKIDKCFDECNYERSDSTVILINVSFGDETKKMSFQFENLEIDKTLDDLKNHFATKCNNEFEMRFAIVSKSKLIDESIAYTVVNASIKGKIGSYYESKGPGKRTDYNGFRGISQSLSETFDIHLDENFNELDAKLESSESFPC